ncbi:MAG: ATP-dependent sacrificial sulfur transferase LarE [Verrucomicrobiae bacterium]|nr:ATP-dependent sacrificial sulfur transferase LarE [Verrucomicrobiae bacterium]
MTDPRLQALHRLLDSYGRVLVAYSGGVDSSFLLKMAHDRLGDGVIGVIGDSPILPRRELKDALDLAGKMGVEIEVVQTDEMEDEEFLANQENRCYFCKRHFFEKMQFVAREKGIFVLAYGENADDMMDVRPGSLAAAELQVRAPLKEAGFTKEDVRELAAAAGLPNAGKPSSPCLVTRIVGERITREALARVETGEEAIRSMGFGIFRLRHHGGKARLEFSPDDLEKASAEPMRSRIIEVVRGVGYEEVEIDPRGYRRASGLR